MNDAVRQALNRDLAAGRIAHAYAFYGPSGLGQEEVLAEWAASLLCDVGEARACGSCAQCRALAGGTHPDFFRVAPSGPRVKVDVVRDAVTFAHQRPFQARRRLIAFESAELFTPESANTLLKVLEEPPEEVVMVLLAESSDAMLATIRSRCRSLLFTPEPIEALAKTLTAEGHSPEDAHQAAALSGGNPGMARLWLADADFPEAARAVRSLVVASSQAGPAGQEQAIEPLMALAESGRPCLSWIALALRDALAERSGGVPVWLSPAEAQAVAAGRTPLALRNDLRAVELARRAQRSHVTARLNYAVLLSRLSKAPRPA